MTALSSKLSDRDLLFSRRGGWCVIGDDVHNDRDDYRVSESSPAPPRLPVPFRPILPLCQRGIQMTWQQERPGLRDSESELADEERGCQCGIYATSHRLSIDLKLWVGGWVPVGRCQWVVVVGGGGGVCIRVVRVSDRA